MTNGIAKKLSYILSGTGASKEEENEILDLIDGIVKEQIEDLEILINLNEDDFDRGKGKFILWDFIEAQKRGYGLIEKE